MDKKGDKLDRLDGLGVIAGNLFMELGPTKVAWDPKGGVLAKQIVTFRNKAHCCDPLPLYLNEGLFVRFLLFSSGEVSAGEATCKNGVGPQIVGFLFVSRPKVVLVANHPSEQTPRCPNSTSGFPLGRGTWPVSEVHTAWFSACRFAMGTYGIYPLLGREV